MRLRSRTLVLCALALVAACERGGESRAAESGAQAHVQTQPFRDFWTKFREAVQSDNYDSLVALSRFPFELAPALDGEPSRLVDAQEFAAQLPALLAADSGMKAQPESMRTLILATEAEEVSDAADDLVRVGSFEFERDRGQWRLTRAYLEP